MNKAAIEKRLSAYWKMEAANVLLVPGAAVFLALTAGWSLGLASLAAFVPVCLLLVIGAQYWRSKLLQLQSGDALPHGIGRLARLQIPSLVLTGLAVFLAITVWVKPGLAQSAADRWITTFAAVLAALEYVNYYHRQLQHFDHLPDLKRLVSGRGFRRSQMAVDIARWRSAGCAS